LPITRQFRKRKRANRRTLSRTLAGLLSVTIGVAANAGTLVVNKTEDDGSKHTLRWAILENNANGGGNRIQISPTGNPHKDWVIQVNSLLPAIKGPAVIEGKSRGTTTAPK